MSDIKKILFVCVENAGRSQMAEGFFKKYASPKYQPISAGTKPISQINPIVVEVMKEVGIDISNQKPKMLTTDIIEDSWRTINMGCMDKGSCPSLFLSDPLDLNIEDPKGKTIEKVRHIRDQIESKVKELVASLE